MKKKALFSIFLFLCNFTIFATNYNIDNSNYKRNEFSQKVENILSTALDSTLVAYTKVDDSLLYNLTINIDNLEYVESLFTLHCKVSLNEKQLPIDIEFYEESEEVLFQKLSKLLYNTFKYDLSLLFERESDYYLSYNEGVKSFENINDKFNVGDYVYLQNFNGDKSLAIVDAVYENQATINYLYNSSPLVNLDISKGPSNQFGLNISYDYDEALLAITGEYFYLKSLVFPFNTTYLGLSSSYFYNFDYSLNSISIDSNLLIEFPLSILFNKVPVLNSSSIYSKVKLGAMVLDEVTLHSAYEIGYKQYLSSKWKIALAYRMDSNYESYKNVLISFEYMF
jgi:hypothetical protein